MEDIPSMTDYPRINPPVLTKAPETGTYLPYARDQKRLARSWAIPGTKGLEHRVGGLEKEFFRGAVCHDPTNHERMCDIRARKVEKVSEFIPRQTIVTGPRNGDLLVVGWGGTKGHLINAVEDLCAEGYRISLCHFHYINPLPRGVKEIFSRFKKIVVCELNSGQFANYLRMNFQEFEFLQYNKVQGLPFTVTELESHFKNLMEETQNA